MPRVGIGQNFETITPNYFIMKNLLLSTGLIAVLLLLCISCNKDAVDESMEFSKSFEAQKNFVKTNKGADKYGYNWKAHTFQGSVFNAMIGDPLNYGADFFGWDPYWGDDDAYLELAENKDYRVGGQPFWENPDILEFWQYRNMNLKSKNEGFYDDNGVPQYPWIDTGAWITFHYYMGEGENRWSQFQKFIAVRSTDWLDETKGIWYSEDNEEIGLNYMWPNFAAIQVINTGNVPEGMMPNYKSPSHRGLSNKN